MHGNMETGSYVFLALCAFLAGLVDSVGGGGGLIQLPALLVTFPHTTLALLFGTNKFASFFGTSFAAIRFYRAQALPWRLLAIAAGSAFVFSFLGARSVTLLNPEMLRPVLVGVLALVLIYTVCKPSLGNTHTPRLTPRQEMVVASAIGAVLGFYDGFFGPGTGSFMLVSLVLLLGLDFIRASTLAKLMNVATNMAALAYFLPSGYIDYQIGLGMAVANVAGSIVGVQLALTKGARFVRLVLIVVVVALLAKQVQLLISG